MLHNDERRGGRGAVLVCAQTKSSCVARRRHRLSAQRARQVKKLTGFGHTRQKEGPSFS